MRPTAASVDKAPRLKTLGVQNKTRSTQFDRTAGCEPRWLDQGGIVEEACSVTEMLEERETKPGFPLCPERTLGISDSTHRSNGRHKLMPGRRRVAAAAAAESYLPTLCHRRGCCPSGTHHRALPEHRGRRCWGHPGRAATLFPLALLAERPLSQSVTPYERTS